MKKYEGFLTKAFGAVALSEVTRSVLMKQAMLSFVARQATLITHSFDAALDAYVERSKEFKKSIHLLKRGTTEAVPVTSVQTQKKFSESGIEVVTKFQDDLDENFRDVQVCRRVLFLLEQLQIPIPIDKNEYLKGTEGILLFSNRYGVVIRIEKKKLEFRSDAQRVENHPRVLQPLAVFDLGSAVVEICPGQHGVNNKGIVDDLKEELRETNVKYWDDQIGNTGILGLRLPQFPDGIPIVIDRGAVGLLSDEVADVKKALEQFNGKDPQAVLFSGLRRQIKRAWPEGAEKADPRMMEGFWRMCEGYVWRNILVAGWNDERDDSWKRDEPRRAALLLDQRFKDLHARLHKPSNKNSAVKFGF